MEHGMMSSNEHHLLTISQTLAAWDVPHEVGPVARLARTLHRAAIRYRNTGQPRWIAESRCMQRDASDLLTYARELRNRNKDA